jgi:hypothetical protein
MEMPLYLSGFSQFSGLTLVLLLLCEHFSVPLALPAVAGVSVVDFGLVVKFALIRVDSRPDGF